MNRITRIGRLAAYDEDFALWSAEQAALLRAGHQDGLDRENLAEEIESLGRSERKEIRKRLRVLLAHLLKWQRQPAKRKGGWASTILTQRRELHRTLAENPSLRSHPSDVLDEAYEIARLKAADETGLPMATFPAVCPFTIDEILDPDFLPDAP
ncbi:DUF29 domain-containing protein [Aquibium sp. ELW1220]|uniref:DUF29 domain-containing protein n=1 Tax=Aquibium sp. ELW1220 TaxID=2976766 RepID=UPI0025B04E46|nr:DUF29 domain-containing protein [Aquibium sp. ELW1220]MDN2581768.1 DUF29 domain-containing protein [Aquibium sp. ELW1220]